MFPLGTVLLPSVPLSLHVFEPRYRVLVHDCLLGAREFGVVLIERGSEVGGDDVRSDVGTLARITEAVELPDGRWALEAVGVRRLRVLSWLPDDPYPQADVAEWPDPAPTESCREMLEHTLERLGEALGLAVEVGDLHAAPTIALSHDCALASHQAVAVAPLGSHDRQGLLRASSPEDRLTQLDALLGDAIEVLRFRLGRG